MNHIRKPDTNNLFFTKRCSGCKAEKHFWEFVPDARKKHGITADCRECRKQRAKANRQKDLPRYRSYRMSPAYMRAYYHKNLARSRAYGKKWRASNRDKTAAAERRRRATNPLHKIRSNLRGILNNAMKTGAACKRSSALKLLGCSIPELRERLQALFLPGMTWANYGKGEGKWHIDHIKPCCSFDLRLESEQSECFHYSNLRPLWGIENMAKATRDRQLSIRAK
jgi:hypothetical protein